MLRRNARRAPSCNDSTEAPGDRGAGVRQPRPWRHHRAGSDADTAVILKGESGDRYKVAGDMAGIASDVIIETGILVDPLLLWEDELKRPEQFSNPKLIDNIKREGVRL